MIIYFQTFVKDLIQDFGASVLWSVLWLAVCIVWTIGAVQMEDFVEDHSICFSNDTQLSRDDANFAQTYNAIVSASNCISIFIFFIFNLAGYRLPISSFLDYFYRVDAKVNFYLSINCYYNVKK